ncbi:MAG: hypothetical protein H6719_30390 [Sandaracinaceae bacterium]|nr:hypothetical protein [Sandaracinaceae bacterium]
MTRALAAALLLALAVAPGAARAQDGREAFVEGTRALEENRIDDALAHFQRSYAESHNPAALFNVARTELVTGRYLATIHTVERLLTDHPDLAPELRAEAEETRTRARARLARLVLLYDPPAPTVEIDGRAATPEGDPPTVVLDPGPHALRASRPGAAPFRWQGELAPGEVTPLQLGAAEPVEPDDPAWPWIVGGGVVLAVAAVVTLAVVLALDAQLGPRHERVLRP